MKRILAIASALLVLAMFAGCSEKERDDLNSVISDAQSDVESGVDSILPGSDTDSKVSSMKNGKYTVNAEEYDESGYLATVTVTISDGKVVSVSIDDVDKDKQSKKALSESGGYGMKEKGNAQGEWHEEIALLEQALTKNGSADIAVNAEGKTDAISGCTISVGKYLDLYNKALEKAQA